MNDIHVYYAHAYGNTLEKSVTQKIFIKKNDMN